MSSTSKSQIYLYSINDIVFMRDNFFFIWNFESHTHKALKQNTRRDLVIVLTLP